VIALLPEVNRETRTLTARVALDNRSDQLAPGMFVSLDVTSPAAEPQLVVPSEAVITTGERSVVIVAGEGGGYRCGRCVGRRGARGRSVILSVSVKASPWSCRGIPDRFRGEPQVDGNRLETEPKP